MVQFDPDHGGLPVMEVDPAASGGGRLVFLQRPRRTCGVTLGVVGMGLLVAIGALAVGRRREEAMAGLALGGFAAAAFVSLGAVLATVRRRLIVDRDAGVMIGSWWFLGIENPTKVSIGEPLRVGWCREIHTTSGSNGTTTETITYPVSLLSKVGGRSRLWRVFVAGKEGDARRLARELAEFLGVDAGEGD